MSLDVAPAPRAVVSAAGRLRRLFRAGSTTPGRLRRVAACLVVGCLLTAVVSVWSGTTKTEAVHKIGQTAQLSADAADLYRSLADADATATKGFVVGGLEPAGVRARYEYDITQATDRVVRVVHQLPADDSADAPVSIIQNRLSVYIELMETARTYNRENKPLGQAYLNYASGLMSRTILPDAKRLQKMQTEALPADYQRGSALPRAVLLIGIAVLAGMVDHAVLERRRTKRVFNPELLAASVALVTALVWWAVAAVYIGAQLEGAKHHSDAAIALEDARVAVLKARSNESLVLVAHSGNKLTDDDFTTQVAPVRGRGGLLADAVRDDPDAEARINAILITFDAWEVAHHYVRYLDDHGMYQQAVHAMTGTGPADSSAAFQRLDTALDSAISTEQKAFTTDDERADSVLAGLTMGIGPAVLALLAAGLVAAGIGRRVAEYR